MISALHVPEITPELMAGMVSQYDLGPRPIINGRLWNSNWEDSEANNGRYKVFAEARYNVKDKVTRWRIFDGFLCLSKSGRWINARSIGNIRFARFDTAKEAIEAYFEWKKKALKRAERLLKKDPQAILNF